MRIEASELQDTIRRINSDHNIDGLYVIGQRSYPHTQVSIEEAKLKAIAAAIRTAKRQIKEAQQFIALAEIAIKSKGI